MQLAMMQETAIGVVLWVCSTRWMVAVVDCAAAVVYVLIYLYDLCRLIADLVQLCWVEI